MNAITAHLSGLKTLDEGLKGTAKFKEPKPFDGKASSVTQFLQDIRNTIQLSHRSLISDHDKCLYFFTYLGPGAPKEWYNSVELHNRELLDDFEKFAESFKKHFGDSNIVATAQNKLDELYQTRSAAQYIARFNEWVIHLDLTDTSKIHMLYQHLKMPNGKSKPSLKLEHNNNVPSSSSLDTLSTGEPMEIDATKVTKPRGPLTKAEREHYRQNGLCMYCRGTNHQVKQCPNMSDKARKAYLEKQSSSVSGKA
ncbi:hypothetical protein WG66_013362 [Moniliophthora roreri]|nr:hypothetical protein WG66_013362 [Moniliophthora roreri]